MEGEKRVVKYGDLIAMMEVAKKVLSQTMSVPVAYSFRRNIESVAQATKELDKERLKIIRTCGIREGEKITVNPETPLYKEILNRDVEVTIRPIDVKGLRFVKLSMSEVRLIEFMFEKESRIIHLGDRRIL